jgi:hypothetical protein
LPVLDVVRSIRVLLTVVGFVHAKGVHGYEEQQQCDLEA